MIGKEKNENMFLNGETLLSDELKKYDFNYCCTDCTSLIEILKINENNNIIEFKCINKNDSHQKSLKINQFLEKRKQQKIVNSNTNTDTCNEHGQKFMSYCFDCNKHICEKCQNEGNHLLHSKINIIEVEPSNEEKEILNKINEYYDEQIDLLKRYCISKSKKINSIIKRKEEKLDEIKNKEIKEIKDKKELEIKKVKEKFLKEIELMKNEFDKNLEKLKLDYKLIYNKINNDFKLKEEKIFYFFEKKKENLIKAMKKFTDEIESEKTKINNITNIKELNEIVYNTYNEYPKNIFNAINISQAIINCYDENLDIKKKVINKIIKNNNDKIFSISRKVNYFIKLIEQKFQTKTRINVRNSNNNNNNQINHKKINSQSIRNNINIKRENINNKDETSDNLFNLFNDIFFKNKEQTSINGNKISENQRDILSSIYFNYISKKKENILFNYFDNFVKCNVLKFFEKERKNVPNQLIDNLIYNIETILECFRLNKYKYRDYYFQNNNKGLKNREKSGEDSKRFRKVFNIDESIIKEEELIKKLEKNDNDIYKVFQQIYG